VSERIIMTERKSRKIAKAALIKSAEWEIRFLLSSLIFEKYHLQHLPNKLGEYLSKLEEK
jgi:hypothetical protein